jgi:hypothetical protein
MDRLIVFLEISRVESKRSNLTDVVGPQPASGTTSEAGRCGKNYGRSKLRP